MLKRPVGRGVRIALAGAVVAGLLLAAGVLRLSAGPVRADWLKSGLERDLAAQVADGRASVGSVGLSWFSESNAFGLQLDEVRLVDGKGREVLEAKRVQAALALDSLLGFSLAPGRITATDFSAVVSVSKQGRWELGYEASGEPEALLSLDQLFADLTGKRRFGRPMSFLRVLDLRRGTLTVRERAGPVAWSADIRELRFTKNRGRFDARADLRLADGGAGRPGVIDATASGAVGMADARLKARFDGIVPASIFPSSGITRPLSALDAVVRGDATVEYELDTGVRSADLRFDAGAGSLRFGAGRQAFRSAVAAASFDKARGEIALHMLKVDADKTGADLVGRFKLIPEDRRKRSPARLDFAVSGPWVKTTLAVDSAPQTLRSVTARGSYLPDQRRIEIVDGRATLEGAPAVVRGALFQDRRGRWGANLTARMVGAVGVKQIFAFWPASLGSTAREWLYAGIIGGSFSNAVFTLDAPAGAFEREILRNNELKLTFDFADTALRFADEMPPVTEGVGSGVLHGNKFELTLRRGRMQGAALSEGSITIPRLKPKGAEAVFKVRATGDAQRLLEVIDTPELRLVSKAGISPSDVSGQADVRVEIMRPMLSHVPLEDYRISYSGQVRRAGLKDAALGFDLENGVLEVSGTKDTIRVEGPGEVGPFRGSIRFTSDFSKSGDAAELIEIDGALRASAFGGRPGQTVDLSGRFRTQDGEGTGTVRSEAFNGRTTWSRARGGRFSLDGQADVRSLRRAGAPLVGGLPDRFPLELTLDQTRDVWRGPVDADALSGNVTFIEGERSRLIYVAEVTPLEARRLGFGRLPLFEQTRELSVDAAWATGEGAARIRTGPLEFLASWKPAADGASEQSVRTELGRAQLEALGFPSFLRPGSSVPVTASWRSRSEGLSGTLDLAGTPARFQSTSTRTGATVQIFATVDRQTLKRWGAPADLDFDGAAAVSGRWNLVEDQPTAGRFDIDLKDAFVGLPRSEWRKPAGRPARINVDFVREARGDLRLTRINGDGTDLDVAGSALIGADGRLISLDLTRVKLEGLVDGAFRVWREPTGDQLNLTARGRWLDARRLFDQLSRGEHAGAVRRSDGPSTPIRLDAQMAAIRMTDQAVLRQVVATGLWADGPARRLEVTAQTAGGVKVSGRLFPQAGVTAISAETEDAGDVANTLFGLTTIKGGRATLGGRLVPGGADLNLRIRDVRLVRAPTMAQILTLASLQGLADTLNGEGVMFNRVEAPVQIRGSKIIVGEARATGQALGLTTTGVADMREDTLDFEGTIAPAYSLNAMVGSVPVVGQLLVSRKGEGVVGLGYSAKGSFDRPQVAVNPLSLVTPGILRRIFESAPPETPPEEKASSRTPTRAPG